MKIKRARFEMRNIGKIISANPVLTEQQIELALYLGQYYFASPGIFIKMMLPKSLTANSKSLIANSNQKQKLILASTIAHAEALAKKEKNVILWHSNLKSSQLNENWWKIKNGQAQIIIGTRSAVFLPFCGLKEILIHDPDNSGHRSWDMFPNYSSLTAAEKLSELFDAKLNFQDSRPTTSDTRPAIIDMRQEMKNGNFSIFSRQLKTAAENALKNNKQIIFFINRRGTANFILCRDCGYTGQCQNCESTLAYHLVNGKPTLFCHHCGHKEEPPAICPKCQSWRIKTVGTGSQKVESEAKKIFPEAKIERLDSDIAPLPKDQEKTIERFAKKEINILVATQTILSWTDRISTAEPGLIGLISTDTLLHLPDYRSGERTFQIIQKLKSLLAPPFVKPASSLSPFDKGGLGGILLLQTYNPENLVLQAAAQNNWQEFFKEELESRKILNYPPYSQIAKLTFRHKDGQKAGREAKILVAKLQRANKNETIEISPALPAFIPREKGKFVWNIIIKFPISPPDFAFLQNRNSLLQYVPSNWKIDIDPENLL